MSTSLTAVRDGRSLRVIFVMLALLGVAACASKSITKSRSQIIADADSKGVKLPSIEEERALFNNYEDLQKQRLKALLKSRAQEGLVDSNYRIGPGDEIELNVFDVPELNLSAKVNQSGFLSLPLVGGVKVTGLTETELHVQLGKRLAAYVKNPEFSVAVSRYNSQRVAVMGAVQKPGTYPLKKGNNSLLELISRAGGITDKAGNVVNFIPAEASGLVAANDAEARAELALASYDNANLQKSAIELYLDNVMGTGGGIPLEIPVRGGDMFVVPEAGSVTVDGEVEKRGSYTLGMQMTLLNALAAAGGITYSANIEEVEVVRQQGVGDAKARLVVNLEKIAQGEDRDIRLRNGDIVRVPSDASRRLRQDTFEAISKVINFGIGGSVPLN